MGILPKRHREELKQEWLHEVYETVSVGSHPRKSFYFLVTLSTIIAGFGLLSNSTAVVIGAMLVAPLMMPIIGMALALSVGDSRLFRDAGLAELFGVLISVGVAGLIGLAALDVEFGPEIMARTTPTTYDIVVALAAGLAGAYGIVDKRINAALPGVAIATSLVPPLTVSGLCLAQGRLDLASSAFLLFFANFLCIQLASAAIFIRFGFNRMELIGIGTPFTYRLFFRRFGLSFLLLVLVTLFMSKTLYQIVSEKIFYRKLQSLVKEETQKHLGAQLAELRYTRNKAGQINAVAFVLTPQEYLPADVHALEKLVADTLGSPVHLTVRSLISKDTDARGPVFMLDEEKLKREQKNKETLFLSAATSHLNAELARMAGARLVDIRRTEQDGVETLNAVVRTPAAIKPEQIKRMQAELRDTLDPGMRLIVRSILTRDADAEHYLYEPETKEKHEEPLTGEALVFFQKLQSTLKQAVAAVKNGSNLLEFQYSQEPERLSILAVVRTPDNFTPLQVKQAQWIVQEQLDSRAVLVVRSVVGVDTGTEGYIPSLDESLFLNNIAATASPAPKPGPESESVPVPAQTPPDAPRQK